MQTGVSVHFVSANVSKCLCPRCPVQIIQSMCEQQSNWNKRRLEQTSIEA